MTALSGRTASRVVASNRMTAARPDQLRPPDLPWPGPPPALPPGDPTSTPPPCGPILVVTTGIAAPFYLKYRNRENASRQARLANEELRTSVT